MGIDLEAVKEQNVKTLNLEFCKELLTSKIFEGNIFREHFAWLVAEVEALREEHEIAKECVKDALLNQLITRPINVQIAELETQLAEANNLAANLKMDKEEMLKEIEQLKEELFEIAAQTPNPIHQGEAILPTATELEDRPYGRSAIGATHQIKIMQEYHKLKQQLTTLTEQHAKAVECLQSASLEPFICGVEQKGLKTILQDREDEINACLKELGVKDE